MNLIQTSRYLRRRVLRRLQLAYTRVATWIPERYPDFICIGAPRAATTWLHRELSGHPDVFLPKRKEVHFYDEPLESGTADSSLRWSGTHYFDMDDPAHLRWYWLHFRQAHDRLAGDITPVYSTLSKQRIGRIHRHNPHAKIIYILRNPIDRAWSGLRKSVWYQKGETYLDGRDDDWALAEIMRPEVLLRGDYPRAIENWESVFPEGQILYLFHDDINENSRAVIRQVYDFLGLAVPDEATREQGSNRVNAAPEKPMPANVKAALQAHYTGQIRQLEQRFDRDLSAWLR